MEDIIKYIKRLYLVYFIIIFVLIILLYIS
nr:MAG TPA: PufQ cytochrome subunit [Microviridae sp.]